MTNRWAEGEKEERLVSGLVNHMKGEEKGLATHDELDQSRVEQDPGRHPVEDSRSDRSRRAIHILIHPSIPNNLEYSSATGAGGSLRRLLRWN